MVTGECTHPGGKVPAWLAVQAVSSTVPNVGTDTDARGTSDTSAPEPTPPCPCHRLGPPDVWPACRASARLLRREAPSSGGWGSRAIWVGCGQLSLCLGPVRAPGRRAPRPRRRGPAPPLPPGYLAPRPRGDRGARAGEAAAATMVRARAGRSRPGWGQRATWGCAAGV